MSFYSSRVCGAQLIFKETAPGEEKTEAQSREVCCGGFDSREGFAPAGRRPRGGVIQGIFGHAFVFGKFSRTCCGKRWVRQPFYSLPGALEVKTLRQRHLNSQGGSGFGIFRHSTIRGKIAARPNWLHDLSMFIAAPFHVASHGIGVWKFQACARSAFAPNITIHV